MTKKTIQFKLPAWTADRDATTAELDRTEGWVENAVNPAVSTEPIGAFTAEAPVSADNDQPVRSAPTRPKGGESFFAVGHSGRIGARMFFRALGDMADCSLVCTLGLQAISREWMSMPLDAVQRSFDSFQVAQCRSLSDLIILQTSLIRSNVEDALARGGRIARISTQVVGEMSHTVTFGLRGDADV